MDLGTVDGIVSTTRRLLRGFVLGAGVAFVAGGAGLGGFCFEGGRATFDESSDTKCIPEISLRLVLLVGGLEGCALTLVPGGVVLFLHFSWPLPPLPNHRPPSLPTPPHPPPLCTPPVPSWRTPEPCITRRPPRPPSGPSRAPNPSNPLGWPTPWRGPSQATDTGCPMAAPMPGCRHAMRCAPATHPRHGPRHLQPCQTTRGEMIFCDVFFNVSKLMLTVSLNFCGANQQLDTNLQNFTTNDENLTSNQTSIPRIH